MENVDIYGCRTQGTCYGGLCGRSNSINDPFDATYTTEHSTTQHIMCMEEGGLSLSSIWCAGDVEP